MLILESLRTDPGRPGCTRPIALVPSFSRDTTTRADGSWFHSPLCRAGAQRRSRDNSAPLARRPGRLSPSPALGRVRTTRTRLGLSTLSARQSDSSAGVQTHPHRRFHRDPQAACCQPGRDRRTPDSGVQRTRYRVGWGLHGGGPSRPACEEGGRGLVYRPRGHGRLSEPRAPAKRRPLRRLRCRPSGLRLPVREPGLRRRLC